MFQRDLGVIHPISDWALLEPRLVWDVFLRTVIVRSSPSDVQAWGEWAGTGGVSSDASSHSSELPSYTQMQTHHEEDELWRFEIPPGIVYEINWVTIWLDNVQHSQGISTLRDEQELLAHMRGSLFSYWHLIIYLKNPHCISKIAAQEGSRTQHFSPSFQQSACVNLGGLKYKAKFKEINLPFGTLLYTKPYKGNSERWKK